MTEHVVNEEDTYTEGCSGMKSRPTQRKENIQIERKGQLEENQRGDRKTKAESSRN